MAAAVPRPPSGGVSGYPPAPRSVNQGGARLAALNPEVPGPQTSEKASGDLAGPLETKQHLEADEGDSSNDGSSPEGKNDGSSSQPGQNNLIVNYLPSHITEPDLRVVYDRSTGKSMGYGFVKFATDEEAANATVATNGLQIAKKRIKVSVARPSSKEIKNSKLYVTNLPDSFAQEDVIQAFEQFGKIIECRTLIDRKTGLSRCTAFVQFDTRREAKHALKYMHGGTLPGAKKPLLVKFAEDHHRRLQRHAQVSDAERLLQIPQGHGPGGSHMGGGYLPHSVAVPGSSVEGDPSSLGQNMASRYAMASHGTAAAAAAYGAAAAAAQGGYSMMGLNNALAMMTVNGAGYAMPSSPMMRGGQGQGQGVLPQMQVPPAYGQAGNGGVGPGGLGYGSMGNSIPQPHQTGPLTPEITQQGAAVPNLDRPSQNNPFALRM